MEVRKNVIAAISAAVQLYMGAEQQAAAVSVVETVKTPEPPRAPFSPWALSGRQAAMDMRRLWQMRLAR